MPLIDFYYILRYLRCLWLPNPVNSHADAIPNPGLSSLLHVRGCVLGLVPDQAGGGAGEDGVARHTIPGANQHIQQCQVNRNKVP